MPMVQLTAEDCIVNEMRSNLNTLRNYHRQSMRSRGRPTESARVYASEMINLADELVEAFPECGEIRRWRDKTVEFARQHALVQDFTS